MYARVVFPAALPGALTYGIPETLLGIVVPGVRVRARLRSVNRVGLVTEVTADAGCDPERVRPLDDVLDVAPLLPAHVLELIRFTADYYAAHLGLVVRTAIPGAALALPPPLIELGPRGREVVAQVTGGERQLLERMLAARRISQARLIAEGWAPGPLRAAVEALASRGAVRVIERGVAEDGGALATGVVLAEIDADERRRRCGRAPAQVRLVEWLEDFGRPALESEVLAAVGCGVGVVRQLVAKGVVRRFQQVRLQAPRRWELAPPPAPNRLSAAQEAALEQVNAAVAAPRFEAFLLFGVTGSGKTEVYLRAAQAAVAAGRQAIVMVPEIGLTPALAGQLAARFGDRVAVLHSSMAEGQRLAAWQRARRGEVDVVAGPRSAIWAPLARPGIIVVDEEQDGSYKQDEEPRYHARDLALVLGQRCGAPVLLASATPALETLALVERGRMRLLELPDRVSGGKLPEVEVVDLKDEPPEPGEHGQRFLSRRVRALLEDTLARGEQAILLVNRRGWAPMLVCRTCGYQATCGDCSIPMTVHRRENALICHYCGTRRPVDGACGACGGDVLTTVGAGTEKIASRVRDVLPAARIDILDRDTARSPAQLLATLERFAAGETDVLVGTQMVSKGHHFPAVTLTVVINADNLLGFPDFRGAEKTFHMLTQVAGRAGRGDRPGTVAIQTWLPDHHAVRAAAEHAPNQFAAAEMRYRRAFRYPPVTRLALVRFDSESERAALDAAHAAAAAVDPPPAGVRVLGPAPAPLARLRGRWRVQVLLFAAARPALRAALAAVSAVAVERSVRRTIDVDPQSTT